MGAFNVYYTDNISSTGSISVLKVEGLELNAGGCRYIK